MRPYLILAFSIVFLCSCNTDKNIQPGVVDLSADQFPQRWELVDMSTMIAGSGTSGEDMEYQEYYLFERDNSFVKTRKQDDITMKASGTFSKNIYENGEQFYELVYDTDSDLIENCSIGRKEHLLIASKNFLTGTASACDYPAKRYERTK